MNMAPSRMKCAGCKSPRSGAVATDTPDPSAHEPITNSQYSTANDYFLHASRDFSLVRIPTIKSIALDHRALFQVVAVQRRRATNEQRGKPQARDQHTKPTGGAQQFLLHTTVSHESLPNIHSSILLIPS